MSGGVFLFVSNSVTSHFTFTFTRFPLTPSTFAASSFFYVSRASLTNTLFPSAALQDRNYPELAAREVVHSYIANVPIKFAKRNATTTTTGTEAKRDTTIDAVNLNVDTGNEGVTMTFVESLDHDDDEEE